MRAREVARNLTMGLFVAGVFVVGLNLLAAGWEWLQYGTVKRDGRPVGLYVEDARHRLHLRPGARLHGLFHTIDINSLGFRGPELETPKPPGVFRVWCVGGSTTFDIYASSNDTTWPARLEQRLRKMAGSSRVEVINAGIPGENLQGSLEDFVHFYPIVGPDVLLIYHGPNDLQKALNAVYGAPPPPEGEPVLPDVALVRLLSRDVAPRLLIRQLHREVNEDVLEFLRREFTRLIDAASRRDVRVVMATHACRAREGARGEEAEDEVGEAAGLYLMEPEQVIAGFRAMNRLIADLAQARGLPLADVRAAVPSDSRFWGDFMHFTDDGSRLAAQAIAETFERQGVMP